MPTILAISGSLRSGWVGRPPADSARVFGNGVVHARQVKAQLQQFLQGFVVSLQR